MSSDNWDEANDTFSENAWELYDWTRSIFAGLSTGQGRNTHPHEYLSRLVKLIEEVEDGVRSRMNESKEEVIAWILVSSLSAVALRFLPVDTHADTALSTAQLLASICAAGDRT